MEYDPDLWVDEMTLPAFDALRAETQKCPVQAFCPSCKGAGAVMRSSTHYGESILFYPVGTKASEVTVLCPVCGQNARKGWLARNSGLEPLERGKRLHSWLIPKPGRNPELSGQRSYALSAIEQAIETRTGLYTFYGDFGSGKTLALQITVNEMRELHTVEGFYAPFAVILDHLRSMWASKQDTTTFWQRLLTIPVLAVDEVTRFNEAKEWEREKLFVLVDTRYRRRESHLTLFATNDDPTAHLATSEDIGYLFSRMRERDNFLVELRGDMRGVA